MLYYDKRLRTWAVRVLIERYSRLDEGASCLPICSFYKSLLYVTIGAGIVPLPKSHDYGTGSIINERHRLRHVQTGRDVAPGGRTLHAWGLSL